MFVLHQPLRVLIPALWVGWAVYWLVAARRVKPTRWRESAGSRALHVIPLFLYAALLMASRALPAMLLARFAPPGRVLPLSGTLLVLSGLALAVWARWHLGRNWSGIVTVKRGHELIRTGPYRVVRHPIYTGLLLALIGTAAAIGEVRGILAVACALIGFLFKIRVEERRMSETFAEYGQYRRQTAALIPLLY
jgi:protein-S-isoprenylcysteine O-methyltransferase Ste14